jgi:hypothetical protein
MAEKVRAEHEPVAPADVHRRQVLTAIEAEQALAPDAFRLEGPDKKTVR